MYTGTVGLHIRFQKFNGTWSVISDDLPNKDCNARFTTIPLKPLSENNIEVVVVYQGLSSNDFLE